MSKEKIHVVILPYFCDEEVDRYLKIAQRLKTFNPPKVRCDYLLAASPRTETSQRLVDAYSELGHVATLDCPTQIFGYPEGPTAMFWDCMDYLSKHYANSGGFGLWLESDMAPVKSDWLDRLSDEWYGDSDYTSDPESLSQTPIMMGCYVPEVYKRRFFKRPKLMLGDHINGGACYAMDFYQHMPAEARQWVFDMAVYKYARKLGRIRRTRQIAFSTTRRARRDVADDAKVLLHGFRQDKDRFLDRCLRPLTQREKNVSRLNPLLNRIEMLSRGVRLRFIRHGHDAVLENVFYSKHQFEASEDAVRRAA